MPFVWTEPQEFMTWRGCTVYHTYKNENLDNRSENFYTLDLVCDGEYEFDVRDLPDVAGVDRSNHKLLIQAALDARNPLIEFPDDVELSDGFDVQAEAWLDGFKQRIEFDAAMWLSDASPADVIALSQCGWRGDEPADKVALDLRGKNYLVASFFAAHDAANTLNMPSDQPVGFECSVDEKTAMQYLKINRPDVYRQVKIALGEAVKIKGTVNETISANISKEVELFVDLDSIGVGLFELETDEAVEKFSEIVKDKAYAKTLFSGGHGWKLESGDSEVDVDIEVVN